MVDDAIRVAAAERVLRAGGMVRIADPGTRIGVISADGLATPAIAAWSAGAAVAGARPRLVMSGHRARALGIAAPADAGIAVSAAAGLDPSVVLQAADPEVAARGLAGRTDLVIERIGRAEEAAVRLAKRAGLLPVLLVSDRDLGESVVDVVTAEAVFAVDATPRVERIVDAPVPTALSERTRLVLFRGSDAPIEHVAVLVGDPQAARAPLCRLHSECLTGDIFGSLRCDCGEQLQGAIAQMEDAGAGVLLYLRQEGRGIGLANKLRAYRLQDAGHDTVDANTHLGFRSDERDFGVAAQMLRSLGFDAVRLLTNNPDKVAQLGRHGIDVVERVPLLFQANRHNRAYLETKARRSGHLIPFAARAAALRTGT